MTSMGTPRIQEMKLREAQCKILMWLSCANVKNRPKMSASTKLTAVNPIETGNPDMIDGIEEKANGALKKFGIER